MLVLVTGCTKINTKDEDKNNDTKDPIVEEPIVEEPKLKIVDVESTTRPIAVMINNHPAARPHHAGLQDAYIMYEIIVEGGFTRYMAIFKDQTTERIGSVRSSRHYYLDYALENDAIYTHFGWSERAKSDISTLKIANVNGLYDSGFWRDKTLGVATEHTAYTNISNIKQLASKKGYRAETNKELLLNYSIEDVNIDGYTDAVVANNVSIDYSYATNTTFVYDPVLRVYNRFVNDKAHNDAVTKKQYTAKNIIIAKVKNFSFDSYGRQDLTNVGTGNGYYITNGFAVPITWNKTSRSEQTVYKYIDGTEITVNDGNTHIQIQPITQKLLISE
jgi:hypothetical protein